MRLSILIVHWNTAGDLRTCLQALQDHPFRGGETETIVVDNASTDGAVAMVRASFPEVHVIENTENALYAKATNQALAAATGANLLLLNPDARVTEGALDTLVRLETDIAAPQLIWPGGGVQPSVRPFPTPRNVLTGRYFRTRFDYTKPGPAPQPMASCLLLTRQVYNTIGGMDERFPLYFNDVDWSLRALRAGFSTYYTPEAVVVHDHGGTTKRVRKAAVWESRRAWLRFNHKHFDRDPLRPLVNALLVLDAWRQTGRWGESLGKDGGETTPESLRRELEREGRSS